MRAGARARGRKGSASAVERRRVDDSRLVEPRSLVNQWFIMVKPSHVNIEGEVLVRQVEGDFQ